MPSEETSSPEETAALGARLAESLVPADVVLVRGELGAGKTTLVRGAARALGVKGPVTSPTFTIGQRYEGQIPVSHLDLYRVAEAGLGGEEPALLDDYLTPDTIAFIEWPGAAEPQLGAAALRIEIEHGGGDRRLVSWA